MGKERERGYRVLGEKELARLTDPTQEFAYDVLSGLSERPKRLPSRYFYDDEGSVLFQRIMELDSYYPTRCEREILTRYRPQILERLGDRPLNVIDLGAGDGAKTILLLEHLAQHKVDYRYVPIDISEGAMQEVVSAARAALPGIEVAGIVAEYIDGARWLAAESEERQNLVLFLGSNIGNFELSRARAFLRRLWAALREGDLTLIGFDLKKDIEALLHAYNDPEGITAKFNLNLLSRINRQLGGRFDLSRFRHFGTYNVFSGAMESYLVSLARQTVYIETLEHGFTFEPWEPVHTEYSYKYLPQDIDALAEATGFVIDASFHDDQRWFVDSLWRVDKTPRRI